MSSIRRQLGLATGTLLAAACVWACTATRHSDGSLELEFAPDMTIRAWGLEEALDDLIGLLGACTSGTFPRPCTDGELDEIGDAIDEVLERKGAMDKPGVRSLNGPEVG